MILECEPVTVSGKGAPSLPASGVRRPQGREEGAAVSSSWRVRPSRGRGRLRVQGDILLPVASVWVFEEDIGGKILTCGQGSQHLALSRVCTLLPSAFLK